MDCTSLEISQPSLVVHSSTYLLSQHLREGCQGCPRHHTRAESNDRHQFFVNSCSTRHLHNCQFSHLSCLSLHGMAPFSFFSSRLGSIACLSFLSLCSCPSKSSVGYLLFFSKVFGFEKSFPCYLRHTQAVSECRRRIYTNYCNQ